jgi:hypothetical protein
MEPMGLALFRVSSMQQMATQQNAAMQRKNHPAMQ